MRIAVWVQDQPATFGGGASYEQHVLDLIDDHDFNEQLDIVFVTEIPGHEKRFSKPLLTISYPKPNYYQVILKILAAVSFSGPINFKSYFLARMNRRRHKQKVIYLELFLKRNRVDIVYYPIQLFCRLLDYPFIATNWDVGHRSTHAFPEFHENRIGRSRNNWYDFILPKALMILTESSAGFNELLNYTSIGKHKIRIVPLLPGKCIYAKPDISVVKHYGLSPQKYFFYPSQFWPHKNHVNLLEAFAQVIHDYPNIKLLLSGSDKGTLEYVKKYADRLNLSEKVLFPGFVTEDAIASFYKHALALVMPSYLGPTNIPLLEAREFDCPIICSDLEGHVETLGLSAIYFPPDNVAKMTEAMRMVLTGELNFCHLQNASRERIRSNFTPKNFIDSLESAFNDAMIIRRCWK